jgi:predicted transcriptional regulator
MPNMTKRFKELVEQAAAWPEADQDELAEYARDIEARRAGVYVMTDEERTAVNEGLEQIRKGELVPNEQMKTFWKRHELHERSI